MQAMRVEQDVDLMTRARETALSPRLEAARHTSEAYYDGVGDGVSRERARIRRAQAGAIRELRRLHAAHSQACICTACMVTEELDAATNPNGKARKR
jgi:hypothetical protein